MSVYSSRSRREWGEGHSGSVLELTRRLRQGNLSEAVQYTACPGQNVMLHVRSVHKTLSIVQLI